jgi:capsule polysaccharide export protein KpsE/RkpR
MKLEEAIAKFDALEGKALQLIALCEHLKGELQQIGAENEQLKSTVKNQAAEIKALSKKQETLRSQNNFQNVYKISKLVNSITADSEETTDLKSRIDEYIQELNKCIAHLSK